MDKPLLRHPFTTVFLLSLALITQEVIWTRIFSAEFYYTFAFLILSLAVLGLGLGGLTVRLFPSLGHPARISWVLSLTALLSLAGPVMVLHLDLNFAHALGDWAMFGKLVLTLFLLGSSFFTTLIKQFRAKNDGSEKTDSMFTGIPERAESFFRNKYGEENLKKVAL